jgi:hypothetical protein
MIKATFILQPVPHPARGLALQAVRDAPDGMVVQIAEPKRNLEQNALMWSLLKPISEQVEWQINGAVAHLDSEDWKNLLTASFRKESVRIAPGVDGGMVLLGARTSKFSIKEFSEWIEYLYWFCAEKGVVLTPKTEAETSMRLP